MSSDSNFTMASWFLGNVHVKPISTHSAPPYFGRYTYVAAKPAKPSPSNCLGSLFSPWIFRPSFGPENSIIKRSYLHTCKKAAKNWMLYMCVRV